MNRTFIVMLAAVSSALPSPWLTAQTPLIVSFVHSEGELVPVARFDGKTWRNTWPEPVDDDAPLPVRTVAEIPRAWLGGPVPLQWTVWSPDTGDYRQVRLTGVEREGSCVEAVTLATSPKAAPADGLAFNRPARVDRILELEESSHESDRLRRQIAPHFRTAIHKPPASPPDDEQVAAQVLARARADRLADEDLTVQTVFQDSTSPTFFIEVMRQFSDIPSDTSHDAVSYGGWFAHAGPSRGAMTPISASVMPFSTAEGKLPRYTPVGILRVGAAHIWVMSEWGIESQTIVLFEVSAKGVRQLTSALISGC